MSKHSLEDTVEQMDEAFNRGDIQAILDFYEDKAIIIYGALLRECSSRKLL